MSYAYIGDIYGVFENKNGEFCCTRISFVHGTIRCCLTKII